MFSFMGKAKAVSAGAKAPVTGTSTNQVSPKETPKSQKPVEIPKAQSSAKPAVSPKSEAGVKVKSKTKFLDVEYLAVILLIIIVFSGAKVYALSITAPDSVSITDKAVFNVDITNDSALAKDISLSLYSPARVDISAPKQIAPNSTGTAAITIYNNASTPEDITGTIELVSGAEKVEKEINLSFKENPANSLSAAFSALFSFPIFNEEIASFSATDWAVFWVLVIVAAVLVAAFISRLVRRAS